MKLLGIDTETGGLDPENASLLTAYLEVVDENFNVLGFLDLKVMPDDGNIKANPEALKINKIDLDEHRKEAISYSQAKKVITAFLEQHGSRNNPLVPVGHNVAFDLNFINTHLIPKPLWNKTVSYRSLDTSSLAAFFKLCNWFDQDQKMSLGDITKSMGIEFKGEAHTAKADVKACLEVLKMFVDSMKEVK